MYFKDAAYEDWKNLRAIYEAELRVTIYVCRHIWMFYNSYPWQPASTKWKTKEEAAAGLLEFCATRFELVGADPTIIDPNKKRSPTPTPGEEMQTINITKAAPEDPSEKSLSHSVVHTSEVIYCDELDKYSCAAVSYIPFSGNENRGMACEVATARREQGLRMSIYSS